mmetsp:Transcript_3876/g.5331  ORF Transcript_3876/g.5331 Transcript_3876/m.5331 type:complete len:221 (+) Transcript_3876:58-720(+)
MSGKVHKFDSGGNSLLKTSRKGSANRPRRQAHSNHDNSSEHRNNGPSTFSSPSSQQHNFMLTKARSMNYIENIEDQDTDNESVDRRFSANTRLKPFPKKKKVCFSNPLIIPATKIHSSHHTSLTTTDSSEGFDSHDNSTSTDELDSSFTNPSQHHEKKPTPLERQLSAKNGQTAVLFPILKKTLPNKRKKVVKKGQYDRIEENSSISNAAMAVMTACIIC